jgi:hypothetical protein
MPMDAKFPAISRLTRPCRRLQVSTARRAVTESVPGSCACAQAVSWMRAAGAGGGGAVPELAQNAEQLVHCGLRGLHESLRVRVVAGQRRPERQPVPVRLGQRPGPVRASERLKPGARLQARRLACRSAQRFRQVVVGVDDQRRALGHPRRPHHARPAPRPPTNQCRSAHRLRPGGGHPCRRHNGGTQITRLGATPTTSRQTDAVAHSGGSGVGASGCLCG